MSDFSKFRTAVSGFNRTDVVNYIESTSIEHQKALRKLTDERDKLAAENARLQVELAGLQKRLEQAQADNDALSGQVNALAQEGSDLAEQLKNCGILIHPCIDGCCFTLGLRAPIETDRFIKAAREILMPKNRVH